MEIGIGTTDIQYSTGAGLLDARPPVDRRRTLSATDSSRLLNEPGVAGQTRRSQMRWMLLLLVSAIYTLALLVPFAPDFPKRADSETSWMLVMHAGWNTHPQFGSERIFTYGPYGFCVPPIYYPGTFHLLLAIRAAVACVLLWAIWSIVPKFRRVVDSPLAAAMWMLPLIGVITCSDDVLFPTCSILALISYFYVDGSKLSIKTVLLLAVMALAGLTKFTWFTINSTLVALLTLDQLLFRKRWNFWIPGLYIAFLAALWLAAGQRPASFIDYIRMSSALAGGYTQAMMLLRGEIAELGEFAIAAFLVWILIADTDWRLRRGRGLIHSIAAALMLLATFKQSYVRPDVWHATVAPFLLLAMATLYAIVIWPTLIKSSHRVIWVAALSLCLMNASAAVAHHFSYGMLGQICRSFHDAARSISGASHMIRGDSDLKLRYEAALAEVRAAEQLPPISGSTDVYTNAQCIAFAYGLDYRPRPVFQSYAAYTPGLAAINRDYLQSDKAPQNIIFDVQDIDSRLPSLDDGLSWAQLLTRYDVAGLYQTQSLLRRAPAPRSYTLTPFQTLTAGFDKAIPVPPCAVGAIWANIEVNLSPRGKLAALLYRPPGLLINVHTGSAGEAETYRFIAPIARAGFLLSPLIRTRGEFVSLASTTWKEDLKARSVRDISITAVGFGKVMDPAAFFDRTITVTFSRLDFPRQDLAAIPGWNKRFAPPGGD